MVKLCVEGECLLLVVKVVIGRGRGERERERERERLCSLCGYFIQKSLESQHLGEPPNKKHNVRFRRRTRRSPGPRIIVSALDCLLTSKERSLHPSFIEN
ncbi:hypothetical protein J6590_101276 [Homalodisca vitripennis]|nr:hypothetical protein J6590_101276 [Homalodisca vitripennis]